MEVQALPLSDFVHDDMRFRADGRAVMIDEHLAREFERRGLVRIRMTAFVPRKAVPPGNLLAGGEAQRSVASPPAPVLQQTITPTVPSSRLGLPKHGKSGR